LDAKTGCIVWERSVNSRVRSTVQVGKVNEQYYLFFGDMSGTSYALSAVDGKIIWQKKIENLRPLLLKQCCGRRNNLLESDRYPWVCCKGGGERLSYAPCARQTDQPPGSTHNKQWQLSPNETRGRVQS
jgi:hypothetical protein